MPYVRVFQYLFVRTTYVTRQAVKCAASSPHTTEPSPRRAQVDPASPFSLATFATPIAPVSTCPTTTGGLTIDTSVRQVVGVSLACSDEKRLSYEYSGPFIRTVPTTTRLNPCRVATADLGNYARHEMYAENMSSRRMYDARAQATESAIASAVTTMSLEAACSKEQPTCGLEDMPEAVLSKIAEYLGALNPRAIRSDGIGDAPRSRSSSDRGGSMFCPDSS